MATADNSSFGTFISRVFWMAAGPLILALLAMAIVNSGSGWLTALDAAFFVVLVGLLAARWWEFGTGRAETATGERASSSDLWKYSIGVTAAAVAVWIVANVLGNHWLNG